MRWALWSGAEHLSVVCRILQVSYKSLVAQGDVDSNPLQVFFYLLGWWRGDKHELYARAYACMHSLANVCHTLTLQKREKWKIKKNCVYSFVRFVQYFLSVPSFVRCIKIRCRVELYSPTSSPDLLFIFFVPSGSGCWPRFVLLVSTLVRSEADLQIDLR